MSTDKNLFRRIQKLVITDHLFIQLIKHENKLVQYKQNLIYSHPSSRNE